MKSWYQKIDGRHSGYGDWAYYAKRPHIFHKTGSTSYDNKQLYYRWYEWCWETWGPSKTINDWYNDYRDGKVRPDAHIHNEHWCWEMNEEKDRIFFRTEKEFGLFLLRWE